MRTEDGWLEEWLSEARAQQLAPSETLMARILHDADRVQPASPRMPQPRAERPGRLWFRALGGWAGFGGLAAAAATGFWIGYLPPEVLAPYVPALGAEDASSLGLGLDDPLALLEP